MKLCKRTFALLLVLCMVIPMCLIYVNADVAEKTTDPGIKFWSDTITGSFAGKSNTLKWAADYKSGKSDILPLTWKTQGGVIRYNYSVNGEHLPSWSGLYLASPATPVYGIDNWFTAFMIRNPGEGTFKVTFDMVKMSNTAAEVSVYAIPSQGSDAFKNLYNGYKFDMADANAVNPYLMEAQALIMSTVKSGNLATKLGTISPAAGMEAYKTYEVELRNKLNSKAADGDYIIVLVPETDFEGGTTGKCTVFLEGMTVTKAEGGSTTPTTPAPTTPADTDGSYDFFHSSFTGLQYDSNGGASFENAQEQINALYAAGSLNAIPVAYKSDAPFFINYGVKDTTPDHNFNYDGIRLQQAKIGDWVAIKFKSPGSDTYSITLNYYMLNQNNDTTVNAYLLPGNTADGSIDSMLTNDTKIGSMKFIYNDATNKTIVKGDVTTGKALEADKEYILVLKFMEDNHKPENNRVDIMLSGLSFGKGYEKAPGAFEAVEGEIVAENMIKTAEFYRAITGVNPANGHDLMYLFFKGSSMLVYDIDDKKVIDMKYDTHSTPFGACFDPEGNLWACGAGAFIYKYDPRTGESTRYTFSYDLFGGKKVNGYGILYGDDGYLYFTYWCWIARMDPKTGEVINLSQVPLTVDPSVESDAQFSGHGGMIYKDGNLYLNIFGDLNGDKIKTSYLIKYNIAQNKIVDYMNISECTVNSSYGIGHLNLVGDLLIGTHANRQPPLYVDISGDKMVRLEKLEGFDSCFLNKASDPINGKVYIAGYTDGEETTTSKCMWEIDLETGKITRMSDVVYMQALNVFGATATVTGDDKLPGTSVVLPMNNSATGNVDLVFYNMETRETVIWTDITIGYGGGMQLRALETDPTGRYVYAGAYGTNQIAWYDTVEKTVEVRPGYAHQTDSLKWYKDMLWVGNYSSGSVTRFDPEYYDVDPIVDLMDTVFQQKRMFALTAADNKIFCGTVPDTSRIGGALIWYDLDTDLTYVAAGPNPDQVFYARTTGGFMVWRDVLTDTIQTFDVDGDGLYDFDFILDDKGNDDPTDDLKEQRFYGVVPNQCIDHIFYKDGYIFGSTTRAGGQAAVIDEYKDNAQFFAYSIAEMKLVATFDPATVSQGLENPNSGYIDYIDFLEEDPYEAGKFWSVINDTLLSCSFDFETKQFVNVKEELSMEKGKGYRHAGSTWFDRAVVFDGDFMYLSFHNYGTWMISTADPTLNYQVSRLAVSDMKQAADGNLYYFTNHSNTNNHLTVFRVAEYTQPLVADSVQALIDALPETVTMDNEQQFLTAYLMYVDLSDMAKAQVDATKLNNALSSLEDALAAKCDQLIDAIGTVTLKDEPAIREARNYYDALPEGAKAKVTKLSVLEAAEAKLAELKKADPTFKTINDPDPDESNGKSGKTGLVIAIVAAAVVAVAAVVVLVLVRKKKPEAEASNEEDAADKNMEE